MVKIFLDGTSSSGKSSIAAELAKILKRYKIIAIDDMTAEKWFPTTNKFTKAKTPMDMQNDFMAREANKAKNVIVDDITLDILSLLKGRVFKVLIYTKPKDLARNVKSRTKKDFRYLHVVMQQYSEKFMAGEPDNYIDWISGHEIKSVLELRKNEFVNQSQLNQYAKQICDRLSIPYSSKKYYIKPVYCDYDIKINTSGLSQKQIAQKIIQSINTIKGGGNRSSKSKKCGSSIITIAPSAPRDVNPSRKKSGHRNSEEANKVPNLTEGPP